MMFKIGQNFYLKGTKQRYRIIDTDSGNRYYLISYSNLKRCYLDYLQTRVTEQELKEKYQLIYKEV